MKGAPECKKVATNEKYRETNEGFKERTLVGTDRADQVGRPKKAAMGIKIKTIPWEVVKSRIYAILGLPIE